MDLYLLKLFLSILLLLLHNRTAHAQQLCTEDEGISNKITFKSNRDDLLNSIITGATKNDGFFNDTVGKQGDLFYGLAICYADSNHTTCNTCLNTVRQNIIDVCPNSTVVGFWEIPVPGVPSCFIRYSNENFFNVANTTWHIESSSWNYSDSKLFVDTRNKLFEKLIAQTNISEKLMDSGSNSLMGTDNLYGLLQCTRDLDHQMCNNCLSTLIDILQPKHAIGVRLYGFSCYVRYETKAFMPLQYAGTVTPIKKDKESNTPIIGAVVGGVATLLVLIAIYIWFKKKRSPLDRIKREIEGVSASEFVIYDYNAIRNATDNFSDRLEAGTLPSSHEIAVKRLSTSSTQGATEFKNEVELLVQLRHINLVKLLGCCIYKDERMLCYEFLPNGSLDKILFGIDNIKCKELEWSTRDRIIKGICRGLLYLHEESPLKIVHRDLKASNILIDKYMNPKIADFGLARLFDRDQTHCTTDRIAGSFGYFAPEYGMQGRFSAKSDTYSFGILVLEIVSGRNNSKFPGSKFMSGLIKHVWKNWSEGKVVEIKDATLDHECIEEVTKCIHIALLCLQKNPSHRPNMETVNNLLNSSSIASLPPLPPPIFIWGADPPTFEDDDVVANFSRESSVVGAETAVDSSNSSFNWRA